MPDAMDRFLTVNDFPASGDNFDAPQSVQQDLPTSDDLFPAAVRTPDHGPQSRGSCLYFGPRGERCTRPASESSFCAQHQSGGTDADSISPRFLGRAMTAFGVLALILPILVDVLRALARWLHFPWVPTPLLSRPSY